MFNQNYFNPESPIEIPVSKNTKPFDMKVLQTNNPQASMSTSLLNDTDSFSITDNLSKNDISNHFSQFQPKNSTGNIMSSIQGKCKGAFYG
jgi:hypothetical protein